MIDLDDDARDALAEAFNLALGEAAASFAEIVQDEIVMSVPVVELMHRRDLVERLRHMPHPSEGSGKLCSIAQHFDGADGLLGTEAMLLFPERGSLEIVRCMLGESSPAAEQISELEQDALAEVGNIIINSCMNSLAMIFDTEMIGTLPGVRAAEPDDLFTHMPDSDTVLVARIGMCMQSHKINGFVLFLMNIASLTRSVERIRTYFGLAVEA
jgi:chemotaxis protein CheC